MDNKDLGLIFGGVISFIGIALFIGIRRRQVLAKQAALIMFILPFIFETIVVLIRGGELLQIVCMGSLLSLSFGPATYFFGRALEERGSKQKK
jgi:hypothetical protein